MALPHNLRISRSAAETGAMRINVTGDFRGGARALNTFKRKLMNAKKPLRQSIDRFMKVSVMKRFNVGGMPKWKSRVKDVPWPILDKTGAMKASVTTGTADTNISYPKNNTIELSTNVEYAGYHDKERGYGAPNTRIPGRPFLYLTDENIKEFTEILEKWSMQQAKNSGLEATK